MNAQLKDASDVLKIVGAGALVAMGQNGRLFAPKNVSPRNSAATASEADEGENSKWQHALSISVLSAPELMVRGLPDRKKLLGEWFCEGDLGFVFAPRGVGKTWFGLDLTCCLVTGGTMGEWKAPGAVPVLYVDGEMPADQIRERIRGLGGDSEKLFVLNHQVLFDSAEQVLNITNPVIQAELTEYCVQARIKVLVLDNQSSLASGMKENEGDAWEMVLAWLLDMRRRGIAVVIIHHAGRNGEMRGTSRREDAAFWIVSLTDTKDTDSDPRGARFVSRFTKKRNTQELIPAYEWHYQTDLASGEVRRAHKVADNLDVLRQMVGAGIGRCNELAEEMDVSPGQVSKLAKRAMDAGWLKMGSGRAYCLVEAPGTGNEEDEN
jgi:hypothetical protein